MLALALLCFFPWFVVLSCLFGGQRFGTAESKVGAFFLYLATQLLWVLPIASFFVGLDYYRRGFERIGIAVLLCGAAITAAGCVLLGMQ
mgnify:CR=1 FL=1